MMLKPLNWILKKVNVNDATKVLPGDSTKTSTESCRRNDDDEDAIAIADSEIIANADAIDDADANATDADDNDDITDEMGRTELHIKVDKMARLDQQTIIFIKCLLTSTNAHVQDVHGQTPAHIFLKNISSGKIQRQYNWFSRESRSSFLAHVRDTVKSLANKNNMNVVDSDGNCLLHYALMGSDVDFETISMLAFQSNMDIRNKKGQTALHIHISEYECSTDIVNLLRTPRNVNMQDEQGCLPIHIAFDHQNVKNVLTDSTFRYLISHSNKDIQDSKGRTPLHACFWNYTYQKCNELKQTYLLSPLISSKNLDMTDEQGRTPLHWYLIQSYVQAISKEILSMLATRRNIVIVDKDGNTPAHVSLSHQFTFSQLFIL